MLVLDLQRLPSLPLNASCLSLVLVICTLLFVDLQIGRVYYNVGVISLSFPSLFFFDLLVSP